MNDINERLSSSLVYEFDAPLRLSSLDGLPDEIRLADFEQQNQKILKAHWLFQEEVAHELSSDKDVFAQEMVRLDYKMDIILSLLGKLLSSNEYLPEQRRVRLAASQIQWNSSEKFQLGGYVQIELFILSSLPMPLILVGKIDKCESSEKGQLLGLTFQSLGENGNSLLEKIIFREHRRQIARSHHS